MDFDVPATSVVFRNSVGAVFSFRCPFPHNTANSGCVRPDVFSTVSSVLVRDDRVAREEEGPGGTHVGRSRLLLLNITSRMWIAKGVWIVVCVCVFPGVSAHRHLSYSGRTDGTACTREAYSDTNHIKVQLFLLRRNTMYTRRPDGTLVGGASWRTRPGARVDQHLQ